MKSHIQALDAAHANYQTIYYNAANGAPAWLRHVQFDAVILHQSLLGMRWFTFFHNWKLKLRWMADLNCLKIAIPQDEYDSSEILDEWLYELGVSVIFSNFSAPQRRLLYPIMHDKAVFYECLTGYIDEQGAQKYARQLVPLKDRPIDIIYRAKNLPYWRGQQGQLKPRLAEVVQKQAAKQGFTWDISTRREDTFWGDRWLDFLCSGRVIIGPESGSSVLDRRGEIRAQIINILQAEPALSFEEVSSRLPSGWDDYRLFAIGPRHLEAVITKTAQILVEGRYNNVLEADNHYIPLKRDFSNLAEVLEKTRDHQFLQDMVDRAYEDIYIHGDYSYRRLGKSLDQALQLPGNYPTNHARSYGNILAWHLARLSRRIADIRAIPEYWLVKLYQSG